MEKHMVTYQSGESRENPGRGIDYMQVIVENDGDEIELYAEEDPADCIADINEVSDDDNFDDDSITYCDLKQEILRQAAEKGINPETLKFWYD